MPVSDRDEARDGVCIRDVHDNLLVSITLKHGRLLQSFSPGFLYNFLTRSGVGFVQCDYAFEIDLLVQVGLKCRC